MNSTIKSVITGTGSYIPTKHIRNEDFLLNEFYDAILKRLFSLYDIADVPKDIMPMTIAWLGNSYVATIPTLLYLILKDQLKPHKINKGDTLVFASVVAGKNINVLVCKM
jgi:3-oxoacyl-[acyl-carrier-protein] synthase-3